MSENRRRKRLVLLVILGVAVVLVAGLVIGTCRFSAIDTAGQAEATAEQQGKSAVDKPATTPAAKPRAPGTPEKSEDGGSDGEATEEAPSPNTTSTPGPPNSGSTGSDKPSTGGGAGSGSGSGAGAGSGSGGGSTGGSGGSNKTWHEGWNEWVVDVSGHNERQLVSAAWDEETGHYGNRCNICGAETTGFAGQHMLDTGHAGYTNYYWFVDGAIHHEAVYQDVWVPEQGHNVWHEGYWE